MILYFIPHKVELCSRVGFWAWVSIWREMLYQGPFTQGSFMADHKVRLRFLGVKGA